MIERKRWNKILKFIQENYAWFIAVTTGLSVVVNNILKFIEYLKANVYFSYYGIDINLYQYSDQGFIYSLCVSILYLLALWSLLYCFHQTMINLKNKRFINKSNLINIVIILACNLCLILTSNIKLDLSNIIINFILYVITELIGAIILFYSPSKNKRVSEEISMREEFSNYVKILPFILMILIILSGIKTQISLENKRSYKIINNEKVIVYSNNNYYLTLDCEINDNNLIIYKGRQEKINNTGIYSIYTKFEGVEIK